MAKVSSSPIMVLCWIAMIAKAMDGELPLQNGKARLQIVARMSANNAASQFQANQ